MKSSNLFAVLSVLFLTFFFSCTKINEATELGDGLIPAVDNVNTFDTTITLDAAYRMFNDTSRHFVTENMALGRINDPVFGTANADMYFNLSSGATGTGYGAYQFGVSKDSFAGIDSVVLSLSYQAAYGDSANSQVTVEVYEIPQGSDFKDDSSYRFTQPGFAIGTVIGTKSFAVNRLKDSVQVLRKGDTTKVANVLRIPLAVSLGQRLSTPDTSFYRNDSIFRTIFFRGLAVKTISASGQGAFAYFNLYDLAKSRLIVYYKTKTANGTDDAATVFTHARPVGQANAIARVPSGDYVTNLNNPNAQNFYLQSSPAGSYIGIRLPGFEAFPNKVIHRAELIATKVSSASDNVFTGPNLLFLDHKNPAAFSTSDSAYFFDRDVSTSLDGTPDFATFGGAIRSDGTYRFNITRYVQGIVTRKERNDSIRLYAPFRAFVYSPTTKQVLQYPFNNVLDNIAKGRLVIAGSSHPDPAKRLRLRIVYSNL